MILHITHSRGCKPHKRCGPPTLNIDYYPLSRPTKFQISPSLFLPRFSSILIFLKEWQRQYHGTIGAHQMFVFSGMAGPGMAEFKLPLAAIEFCRHSL